LNFGPMRRVYFFIYDLCKSCYLKDENSLQQLQKRWLLKF